MKLNLVAGAALALVSMGVANAERIDPAAQASLTDAAGDAGGADASGASADWAGYAHVGYRLDPHWRVELRGGYHAGATGPAALGGAAADDCADAELGLACEPREAPLGAFSASANLVFDALPDSRWVDPFVSVGAGVRRFDPGVTALARPAWQLRQMDPAADGLSYQALVGLAFRPHDRLHFDLTYRWMDGLELAANGQPFDINPRFQDQTVAITVRYALGLPRRAVAPAPALALASTGALTQLAAEAPGAHTVVVETPSHPEALSAEAEAAVGETALSASQGRSSQVVVDGHADTASAAAYNQRLSERRAKAMADAMVSLGVPVSAIDVRWGDGALAAPADGEGAAIEPTPAGRGAESRRIEPQA